MTQALAAGDWSSRLCDTNWAKKNGHVAAKELGQQRNQVMEIYTAPFAGGFQSGGGRVASGTL